MKVILLAAGVGRRFGKATRSLPKCLVPLGNGNKTLLSLYLNSFRKLGLRRIVIVCGHQKEKLKKACQTMGHGLGIRFVNNPQYKKGSIVSLRCVRKELDEDCVIMDADVFFPTQALAKLLNSKQKTCFLVDRKTKSTGEEMMLMAKNNRPVRISKSVDRSLKILGESIGFLKICRKDAIALKGILEDFHAKIEKSGHFWQGMEYEESYNVLMQNTKVGYEAIGKLFWTEMDFKKDLIRIQRVLASPVEFLLSLS